MALKEFRTSDGRAWRVWETHPTETRDSNATSLRARFLARHPEESAADFGLVSRRRLGGWLTFATSNERRRLSPIPAGWEEADEIGLRQLLARADEELGPMK